MASDRDQVRDLSTEWLPDGRRLRHSVTQRATKTERDRDQVREFLPDEWTLRYSRKPRRTFDVAMAFNHRLKIATVVANRERLYKNNVTKCLERLSRWFEEHGIGVDDASGYVVDFDLTVHTLWGKPRCLSCFDCVKVLGSDGRDYTVDCRKCGNCSGGRRDRHGGIWYGMPGDLFDGIPFSYIEWTNIPAMKLPLILIILKLLSQLPEISMFI